MGDDLTIGAVTLTDGEYKIMTNNGLVGVTSANVLTQGTTNTVSIRAPALDLDSFLDRHSFNKFTVDHKVSEHEFLKLKESVPTYADEIKENLSKNLARDIIKKATFTKKKDVDADVHHFLGRVWVFTEDELKNLINEARNV
jgi:hypothetical protein